MNLTERLDRFRELFVDDDFLANRGLSNEVGLYIFAYHPGEEMTVRSFLRDAREKFTHNSRGGRAIVYDLYDILLDICRDRRILEKIPQMERERGQDFMCKQLQRIATPESYIDRMRYAPHRRGDVVLITGIGRVYPYMRSHNILNNLQHVFDDIPVVLFYPGDYSGQSLTLFEKFADDNYYRAFNLL